MKKNKTIYGLALCALGGGMLASCSNDTIIDEPTNQPSQSEEAIYMSLLHAPEAYVWSGKEVLGGATRALATRDGEDTEETETKDLTSEYHSDEVEINLSVNDIHIVNEKQKYENADLWTKLSIHVRKATNVTITLPIAEKYVVESDDFAIFQRHLNSTNESMGATTGDRAPVPHIAENETRHSFAYSIPEIGTAELDVTFHENYIEIKLSGITTEMINYLESKNGDGINFEIWNYFQTDKKGSGTVIVDDLQYSSDLTREKLWNILNGYDKDSTGTTVSFTDDAPLYYINSFGFKWMATAGLHGQHTEDINPWDCWVAPVSDFNQYDYFCYHLNGSPWNVIWINNRITDTEKESARYEAHTNAFYNVDHKELAVKPEAKTVTTPENNTDEED